MEFHENDFLEELLALKAIPKFPPEINELLSSDQWNYNCFDESPYCKAALPPNPFYEGLLSPSLDQDFTNSNYYFNEVCCPVGENIIEFPAAAVAPQLCAEDFSSAAQQFTDSSYNTLDASSFGIQEDAPMSKLEAESNQGGLFQNELELIQGSCKVEPITQSPDQAPPVFNIGSTSTSNLPERKARGKKLEGQPSKNLMAERRRRKRLNDRLSMLRSIVPKISKMDRTSILGDTIDYMKELLERINNLQQQIDEVGSDQLNMMSIFEDTKPNEIVIRNSPKFDVERRNVDTRIEICCSTKPGLLLSTITTLEALGLEIQQCVISCFNDFAMQASCSEEMEQRKLVSSEDIKQALFRSAGYGGRCL